MTCIVGLRAPDGAIWIGGDSLGTRNSSTTIVRHDPKVFTRGPYLFGFTSSYRMGQILRHDCILPEPPREKDLHCFMVRDFVPAIRTALKQGGFATTSASQEQGGSFLVAVRGQLFHVEGDYQVGCPGDYCVTGCGLDIALGALAVTKRWRDPRRRILAVLEATALHCAFVGGPFVVLRQGVEDE